MDAVLGDSGMKYLLLFLLISCNKKPEVETKKNRLNENQQAFYSQSSIEFKAYFDSCMESEYRRFKDCYEEFKKINNGKIQASNSVGVGEVAIGTAIGGVASRVITRGLK